MRLETRRGLAGEIAGPAAGFGRPIDRPARRAANAGRRIPAGRRPVGRAGRPPGDPSGSSADRPARPIVAAARESSAAKRLRCSSPRFAAAIAVSARFRRATRATTRSRGAAGASIASSRNRSNSNTWRDDAVGRNKLTSNSIAPCPTVPTGSPAAKFLSAGRRGPWSVGRSAARRSLRSRRGDPWKFQRLLGLEQFDGLFRRHDVGRGGKRLVHAAERLGAKTAVERRATRPGGDRSAARPVRRAFRPSRPSIATPPPATPPAPRAAPGGTINAAGRRG